MQRQPFAVFIGSKNERLMVEPPAASMNSVQIGNRLRMRDNVAVRVAPGLRPGQHSRKEAALMCSDQRFGITRERVAVFPLFIHVGIDGSVESSDLFFGEKVPYDKKTLQIEQKLFSVIHILLL